MRRRLILVSAFSTVLMALANPAFAVVTSGY